LDTLFPAQHRFRTSGAPPRYYAARGPDTAKSPGVSTISVDIRELNRNMGPPMSLTKNAVIERFGRTHGFTLIEIIVVITIMAIMAALIVPRVVGRTDDARIAAAHQDIATLMNALKLYRLDNGRYPTTEQGLRALVERPTVDPMPSNWKSGGYLDAPSVRKDPWGNDYQYLNPGLHSEVDVMSFGRDGQPGGEGPDADIGSWTQ
jgi:general secretion pathway protein G